MRVTKKKNVVSIFLQTADGAEPLAKVVGKFPQKQLLASDEDDAGEDLYFTLQQYSGSESYYGQTLHAVRALGLPEEPAGICALYDYHCASKPGTKQGGHVLVGSFACDENTKEIGDRKRDQEGCVSVWIEVDTELAPDEYIGWYDEDFGEHGGSKGDVAALLKGMSYGDEWIPAAVKAAAKLGVKGGRGAFVLFKTKYAQKAGPMPWAPGVVFLGTFAYEAKPR
jgi:hypothetical protein